MSRKKMFVEYPVAESLKQAIAWMEAGNKCWQEDSNEWPECGGFDDIECLKENFPDGLDESDNVHLVTKILEQASDFKIGDEVVALEDVDYCHGQDEDDKINRLSVNYIDSIIIGHNYEQLLFFHDHPNKYGPWNASNFVLNVCGDD